MSAPPTHNDSRPFLGRRSGAGLVIANMIGAGVFLSTGFMAQDMGPGPILSAWIAGTLLALCGARAYAELAVVAPCSGGEYHYLSRFLNPSLGALAGFSSLLLGFAGPMAIDAYGAGAFVRTQGLDWPVHHTGAAIIVAVTLLHAFSLRLSVRLQNVLVATKLLLVAGFVVAGLALGKLSWPDWQPATRTPGFPWRAFFENQLWITFAFSGWNAAVYVAGSFREPRRDVPWAVLTGFGIVAALYMLVNWIFVANLTPEHAAAVLRYDETRVTLGHLVMDEIAGPTSGRLVSLCAAAALVSSISAMSMIGARVFATMAAAGHLPQWFDENPGRPPIRALAIQAAAALLFLYTRELQDLVSTTSVMLLCFSALTTIVLLRIRANHPELPAPSGVAVAAAVIYTLGASAIVLHRLLTSDTALKATIAVAVAGLGIAKLRQARVSAAPLVEPAEGPR